MQKNASGEIGRSSWSNHAAPTAIYLLIILYPLGTKWKSADRSVGRMCALSNKSSRSIIQQKFFRHLTSPLTSIHASWSERWDLIDDNSIILLIIIFLFLAELRVIKFSIEILLLYVYNYIHIYFFNRSILYFNFLYAVYFTCYFNNRKKHYLLEKINNWII